jgi:hypothetical protein
MTYTPNATQAPSEAGLNLLWPGFAQCAQGRIGAAVWFSFEAACACAACVWFPSGRPIAVVAFLTVMVWSIVDARLAELERIG